MKKKVCFFINSGWYFELHWLDRAKLFLDDGYDVHVIANFKSHEIDALNQQGFKCHQSNMNERSLNVFSSFKDFFQIFNMLRHIKPNVLHAITIKPIIIGGIYSRLKNTAFVASFVGLGRVFMNQTLFFKVLNFLVKKTYGFIFRNPHSRLTFEHQNDLLLLKSLIRVADNQCSVIDGVGIKLNEYKYCPERCWSRPIVLFAGRMLHSKGLDVLVEINREFSQTGKAFILNVAGIQIEDDPDAITQQKISEWSNAGLINWLGRRSDIPKLIEECNVVALPSTYFEGVPRIIIEGAAVGRACIVYDSGGCNSIVEDGISGYVIKRGDKDEFKRKLQYLFLNSELRSNMGSEGRKIVEDRFSLESVYNKTKLLYLEII